MWCKNSPHPQTGRGGLLEAVYAETVFLKYRKQPEITTNTAINAASENAGNFHIHFLCSLSLAGLEFLYGREVVFRLFADKITFRETFASPHPTVYKNVSRRFHQNRPLPCSGHSFFIQKSRPDFNI